MPLHILPVDYQNPAHRQALVMLLDAYAQDPMGGGEALAPDVKTRLCDDLAARTDAASSSPGWAMHRWAWSTASRAIRPSRQSP